MSTLSRHIERNEEQSNNAWHVRGSTSIRWGLCIEHSVPRNLATLLSQPESVANAHRAWGARLSWWAALTLVLVPALTTLLHWLLREHHGIRNGVGDYKNRTSDFTPDSKRGFRSYVEDSDGRCKHVAAWVWEAWTLAERRRSEDKHLVEAAEYSLGVLKERCQRLVSLDSLRILTR